MKKVADIVLNGRKYYCSQLPAWAQYGLLNRIGAAISPALGQVLGGKSKNLMEVDLATLGPAFEKLFEKLSRSEQEGITKELLSTVTFEDVDDEGKRIGGPLLAQFDTAMQGRMLDLIKLLKFAFDVNYGSFSNALGTFLGPSGAQK